MNYILSFVKNSLLVGSYVLLFLVLNGCSEELVGQGTSFRNEPPHQVLPPAQGVIPDIQRSRVAGHIRGLVLLIQFQEDGKSPQKFKSTQADYEELFNGDKVNTEPTKNFSSVKRYYQDQSGGKLVLTHEISPILQLSKTRTDYPNLTVAVEEAITVLNRDYPDFLRSRRNLFNKTMSDNVPDGDRLVIQALSIIIGGSSSNNYTAHSGKFVEITGDGKVKNKVLDLGDGLYIYYYQMSLEIQRIGFGTFSTIATMAMICHELGHSIANLRDYYDSNTGGLGYHCLMANNLNVIRPVPMNPYLKWLLGWAEFKPLPSSSADLTIGPNENNTYYVHVNPRKRQELYILENRARLSDSWSQSNYSEGLGVWHVDATKWGNFGKQNWHPTADDHYEISFIQANIAAKPLSALTWWNGSFETNKGNDDDCFASLPRLSAFSHETNPAANWWSGLPSGMMLSNIQFDEKTKNITFHYENAFAGAPSDKTVVISQIPESVKEGLNSFDLEVTTTGFDDGETLTLNPPADSWRGQFTAQVQENRAVFGLITPDLDLFRNTHIEVTNWTFRNGLNIFECKTPHAFAVQEGSLPLEIKVIPSRTTVHFYESFELTVEVKNMMDTPAEDRYKVSPIKNQRIFIGSDTQKLHSDGSLTFNGAWYDGELPNSSVMDEVLVTYGTKSNMDGIQYEATEKIVKLTEPITFIFNAPK